MNEPPFKRSENGDGSEVMKMTGERDDKGRFAEGNAGGPGRPRRAVERDYLRAMADVVTPNDWRQIAERARDDALKGNAGARAWLAKYLVGTGELDLSETLTADEHEAALGYRPGDIAGRIFADVSREQGW